MSDDGVLHLLTFDHYHGEDDIKYICWEILKDGKEIINNDMEHESDSHFKIDISWSLEPTFVDYFDVFFKYFFQLLEGKATVLNWYLVKP
jgi:hypothetical protein